MDRQCSRNLALKPAPAPRLLVQVGLSWLLESFCPLSTRTHTPPRDVPYPHTHLCRMDGETRPGGMQEDTSGRQCWTHALACPMVTSSNSCCCSTAPCTAERAWHTSATHTRTSYTYDGTARAGLIWLSGDQRASLCALACSSVLASGSEEAGLLV